MIKLLKKSSTLALSMITIIFTFIPEEFFQKIKLFPKASDEINVVFIRILTFIIILLLSMIGYAIYLYCRKSIVIKGKNYSIKIEYGDILEMSDCKKVINFDECFSTSVGNLPSDINPNSICGQYLQKNPIHNIQLLIDNAQLKPTKGKSKYQGKDRYEPGSLVPNGDDLLMAFAKLDKNGLGSLSYSEYLNCLSLLWKEIDKYYGQKDVCIPILGSGVTRMNGTLFTQQELLDIIIVSYKLSTHKIKCPCQLHIVCKKRDDFSLNKIGEAI